MYIKNYTLDKKTYLKKYGKVFCRRHGEHHGYALFKLPYKIKHPNSLINGDFSNICVLLKSGKLIIIEEYLLQPIKERKEEAKRYLEEPLGMSVLKKIHYDAHLNLLKSAVDSLKF